MNQKIRWLLLIMLVAGLYAQSTAGNKRPPYWQDFSLATIALKKNSLDSATVGFIRAYSAGMPAESLYYFLAEVYVAKGVFDTALGCNYATRIAPSSSRYRLVIEQRQRIYAALKLDNYVTALQDTLDRLRLHSPKILLPALLFNVDGGGSWLTQSLAGDFPFDSTAPHDTSGIGPDGSLVAEIAWNLKLRNRQAIRFGASGRIAAPYSLATSVVQADSMEVGGGFFAEYSWAAFSVSGGWQRSRSVILDQSISVNGNLMLSIPSKKRLTIGSVSYSFDRLDSATSGTHTISAFALVSRLSSPRIMSMIHGFLHIENPIDYPEAPIPVINLVHSIDTFITVVQLDSILEVVETIVPSTHIDATFFVIRPSLQWKSGLGKNMEFSLSGAAPLTIYCNEYSWYSCTPPQSVEQKLAYVSFDPKSGEYIWISPLNWPPVGSDIYTEFSDGPLNLEYYERRRIDLTPEVSISIARKWKHWGRFCLTLAGSLNWSTLNDGEVRPPVSIPRGNVRLGLDWDVGLSF